MKVEEPLKNVCHEVISSKETFFTLNPREEEKEGEAKQALSEVYSFGTLDKFLT